MGSPKWTLEHILLCEELFCYILHACIPGWCIPCGHLAFDLVWCLFFLCTPLMNNIWCMLVPISTCDELACRASVHMP